MIEITGDLAEDAEAARLVAEDGKELSGSMDKIIGSIGVPLDTRALTTSAATASSRLPHAHSLVAALLSLSLCLSVSLCLSLQALRKSAQRRPTPPTGLLTSSGTAPLLTSPY